MKKNNKGFTLMEMLIVVAIIAILVAISIPVFTAQLEKARENTDIANMRAAKAEAVAMYLTEDPNFTVGATYKYDAVNGKLVASTDTVAAYGKGTANPGGVEYGDYENNKDYTKSVITVSVSNAGEVTLAWNPAPTSGT